MRPPQCGRISTNAVHVTPRAAASQMTTQATSGGCCASVELGRTSLESSKTRCCCNLLHTQTPFSAYQAVCIHKCIYTQAHTCVHINTCLWTSGSTVMYVRPVTQSGSDFAAFLLPNQKLPNWKFSFHRRVKHVRWAFRLVSWCQVGGSLCCLCIVHILSSVWAGMGYSWGIWVSQNLTTERGTSWGPAEENEARCWKGSGDFLATVWKI